MTLLRLTNKHNPRPDRYPDAIVPLAEADVQALRLRNSSLVRDDEVIESLRAMPGLSHWHPASGEFVLVSPWRHRSDIPTFRLISAFSHEFDLVGAALQAAEDAGKSAFITTETYERRRPEFYAIHGLNRLETIIAYRHDRVQDFLDVILEPVQEFQVVQADDRELIAQLVTADHAAFPWIWRNSVQEFQWWLEQPAVEVSVGLINGEISSYYGTTYFRNMGHLDRIAVHPQFQGRGLGKETLMVALQRMARLGQQQAALSTQQTNPVSQALYETMGFRRAMNDDYHMYGTLFSAAPDEANSNE